MKCKQVEKILIEQSIHDLDPSTKLAMEDHLNKCAACKEFGENIALIRRSIKKINVPTLSSELEENTMKLCYDEIAFGTERLFVHIESNYKKIPRFIIVALSAIVILTLAWSYPYIKDFFENQVVTQQLNWIFVIGCQNLIMLIFAPLLFRRTRLRKFSF